MIEQTPANLTPSPTNNDNSSRCQLLPYVRSATIEIIKIVSALTFLSIAGAGIFAHSQLSHRIRMTNHIWTKLLLDPLAEEIVFRLISHSVIYSFQYGYNKLLQREELTEEQKTAQKIFRIVLSAILFSLEHVRVNQGRNLFFHVPVTLIGGIAYSGLLERYRTLSIGLLFHGINNLLTRTIVLNPSLYTPLNVAIVVNRCLAFYCCIVR